MYVPPQQTNKIPNNTNNPNNNNNTDDEFTLQQNYTDKIIQKIELCFNNYTNSHGITNKDQIQIEITSLLDDLKEEISQMKKTLASRTDISKIEFSKKEEIIENFKQTHAKLKNKSETQLQSRLDYDPRESLMKKSELEQKRLREEKKKKLDDQYVQAKFEVKKLNRGATKIGELLENDKVKTEKMSESVNNTREKVESTQNHLEEFLSKSSFVNSCSDQCLWITALIELLFILLLLAI